MNRLVRWLRALVDKIFPRDDASLAVTFTTPGVGHNRRKREKTEATREFGTHWHFIDVLDKLDGYYSDIKLLKSIDRNLYSFFSVNGLCIFPSDNFDSSGSYVETGDSSTSGASASIRSGHTMSIGGTYLFNGKKNTGLFVSPSAIIFQKVNFKIGVQTNKGTLYEVTIIYIDGVVKNKSIAQSYFVDLNQDGSVKVLRQKIRLTIKGIPVIRWIIPPFLADISVDNTHEKLSPEERGVDLFRIAYSFVENSQNGFLVKTQKEGISATFRVSSSRTSQFFKDRNKQTTVNGSSKRIFHATKSHFRELKSGKQATVRMHFKGERVFRWNGYDVCISVPGIHHHDLSQFNVAATEFETRSDAKVLGMLDVAKMFSEGHKA